MPVSKLACVCAGFWQPLSRGFIDFFLEAPGIKWGIELLRDGSKAAEHAHRFAEEGIYGRMRESMTAHCLVDFRMKKRQRVVSSLPEFCYVTFQTDYAHANFAFKGVEKTVKLTR